MAAEAVAPRIERNHTADASPTLMPLLFKTLRQRKPRNYLLDILVFFIIFILFSFNKDNCNITFQYLHKLLTVMLLNITHSITMLLSLQHTKLQSLQILQKLRYRKRSYKINKGVQNSAI